MTPFLDDVADFLLVVVSFTTHHVKIQHDSRRILAMSEAQKCVKLLPHGVPRFPTWTFSLPRLFPFSKAHDGVRNGHQKLSLGS